MTYNFLELISTIIGFIIIICVISIFIHLKNEKEEIYDLNDFVEVESNNEVFKLFRNKKTDVYEHFDTTDN